MNPVVTWLDSAEGEAWSRLTFSPTHRAARDWSPNYSPPPVRLGPLNPAEDPCGRPPLRERAS